jgi:TolB-like protein/Flp pilus assembly protein TadD/predicted Ser/Thr protein kinase
VKGVPVVGSVVSHYRILERLGEGGMGVVYRAHDDTLDRDVALKFLPHYLTSDLTEKERFYHEARAAAALTHQNIAVVYEIGEYENQLFIAMEYVEGKRLKQLAEAGPISLQRVLDIAIQVCEGLAAAHEKGIVHRDVKSDNIIVTPKGQPKIMDFGLAKVKGATKLTKTGSTLGTAAYMSPEQALGEEVDQRSDIFSFGVVLYELLSGRLPFRAEHPTALAYAIINDELPPLARFNEKVTPEIERIVSKALAKNRDERYQHADDMLADLRHERKTLEYARAGNIRAGATVPVEEPAKRRRLYGTYVIAAVVVALAVAFVVFNPLNLRLGTEREAPEEPRSIAVLPFTNMGGNKQDEYFSDGITEDIITQLAKIGELKVIARTSVMQYKDTRKSIADIGRELNVSTILEGSVRRSEGQVRVVAQLIDVRNSEHLWAESYDRDMTKIFAIQSDVAQEIARALRAKLSPAVRSSIEKPPTENPEAYQLYLKGRFYWNKRRRDDMWTAISYFKQAILKDPDYGRAYAGLASAYVLLPQYGIPPGEYYDEAQRAALKTLEIDSTIAEAHTVLAQIAQDHRYDWEEAEKHFRRAIELDPGYATAHQWYAIDLSYRSRFDEALAEAKRSAELDPLSPVININVGDMYYVMRQYDKALALYRNTIGLDRTFVWAYMDLAYVYAMQGRYEDAVAECEKARSMGVDTVTYLGALGGLYARAGRKKDAAAVLGQLLRLVQRREAFPFAGIAFINYELGEKDKAFEWFEKAYQSRDLWLPQMAVDPLWDGLRADPRFLALLKRMGLRN